MEAMPKLKPFKDLIGLDISGFGYRVPSKFLLKDFLEILKSNPPLGLNSANPIGIVTGFHLYLENKRLEFEFSQLLQCDNALDFLKRQKRLNFSEDVQLWLDTILVTEEMSLNELLELNAKFLLSPKKIAEPLIADEPAVIIINTPNDLVVHDICEYMQTASKIIASETDMTQLTSESGPSWSGKTQLIYVLDKLSSHPMRLKEKAVTPPSDAKFYCVLHLVMELDNLYQNIYEAHKGVSQAMLLAIQNDFYGLRYFIADLVESGKIDKLRFLCEQLRLDSSWLVKKREGTREIILQSVRKLFTDSVLLSTVFIGIFAEMYPLRTLGVLSELINMRIEKKPLDLFFKKSKIHPLSLSDYKGKPWESQSLPILVCLDEFNLKHSVYKKPLIFLRNLLRCTPRFTPILLGTNAKAANLVDKYSINSNASRRSKYPWCRVLYKLPPANLTSIMPMRFDTVDDKIVNWLRVSCGRPGILKLFVETLYSYDKVNFRILKSAFTRTFEDILILKETLYDCNVMEGYYEMIFSRFRANRVSEHACSPELVNRHLAHLIPNNFTHAEDLPLLQQLFKSRAGGLYTRNDRPGPKREFFTPYSLYLALQADELTQMIIFSDWKVLSGSVDKDLAKIFKDAKKNESLEKAKQEIIHLVNLRPNLNILSFSFRLIVECLHNRQAEYVKSGVGIRSGEKLENLINGSFVKAAASAGPSGCQLKTFLLRFAAELSVETLFDLKWDKNSLTLLGVLKNQRVPYVIAVNYRTTPEFRSIEGVFTGTLPEMSNPTQLDGLCIPDWVQTIYTPQTVENALISSLYKNALIFSDNPNCQMFITLEMKNRTKNIGAGLVSSVLRRAATLGREKAGRWPKSCKHPVYHLHLFCVSSLGAVKNWKRIESHCSHVIKLFKLKFNSENNTIGLKNIFEEPNPTNSQTVSDPQSEVEDPEGKPDPNSGVQTTEKDSDIKSDLNAIAKLPPATPSFPHSTVIIVDLKDLFKYGFESASNITAKPSKRHLPIASSTFKVSGC